MVGRECWFSWLPDHVRSALRGSSVDDLGALWLHLAGTGPNIEAIFDLTLPF
jgi:hypothetical protein